MEENTKKQNENVEEEAIYTLETNSGLKFGTIKFFDNRYKFVSTKGKVIEDKYCNLSKIDISMKDVLNIYDKKGVMQAFVIDKKLISEVVEFLKTKISKNIETEVKTQEGNVIPECENDASSQENKGDNNSPTKSNEWTKVVVVGVIIIALMSIIGSCGGGGVQSDLEGKYVQYRNTVFKQEDGYIYIEGDTLEWYVYGLQMYSGTYEIDEEKEMIYLKDKNSEFHYAYEDGDIVEIYRDTSSGAEKYYKQ